MYDGWTADVIALYVNDRGGHELGSDELLAAMECTCQHLRSEPLDIERGHHRHRRALT